MLKKENRDIEEILDDLKRINQEYREKLREGFKDPGGFIKLSEIEMMGRKLSSDTQKLYLEETAALLNDIDENMLLQKKKRNTKTGE